MDLDVFDAQGRFVAVAAQRVQDLVHCVVDLLGVDLCSAKTRSWPLTSRFSRLGCYAVFADQAAQHMPMFDPGGDIHDAAG
jgi:hypothetical protein